VGSEYMGPAPDPNMQPSPSPIERSSLPDEDTQPRRAVPAPTEEETPFEEPSYREHVSGPLHMPAAGAPNFYPPQPPYQSPASPVNVQAQNPLAGQSYPAAPHPAAGQNGYAPPFNPQPGAYGYAPPFVPQPGYGYPQQFAPQPGYGYPPPQGAYGYPPPFVPQPGAYYGYPPPYYYPYGWPQRRPKRDGYLFGIAIASFVASILVILGGLFSGFVMLINVLVMGTERTGISAGQQFSGIVLFTALTIAGLLGGISSLYHSIRSLFLRKPSMAFKLPWFWLFLALYALLVALGFIVSKQTITNPFLTIFLVLLAGLFPALTFLALADRRIHFPRSGPWPTSWRRFTLAIVSGGTLAIVLAGIFELILTAITVQQFHVTSSVIDNPNLPTPHDPRMIALLLIIVSVIAPIIEEGVKPLAVIVLLGRLHSAGEAFVLGMACGVGFDLIETSGYISMGYHNWVQIALERSTAGLLHGFGAGMVSLGWYYLTHHNTVHNRFLVGLGCIVYAVLQHAIWNGSFVLQLLPAPIGPFLSGNITIFNVQVEAFLLVYVVLSLLMFCFFLWVTGQLRKQQQPPQPVREEGKPAPVRQLQPV